MSPEQYLKEQGICKDKYILVAYIDGVMRNVSLVTLLQGYANTKGCARCKEVCDHEDGAVYPICGKCGKWKHGAVGQIVTLPKTYND